MQLPEYYAPLEGRDRSDVIRWKAFDVTTCDGCGGEVMAPNSMHLSLPHARRPWPSDKPLPEEDAGYCDVIGGLSCHKCWSANNE